MVYASSSLGRIQKDELEGVDIKKEHELIQQKKSSLSARLRRMVELRYEKLTKESR